jgi:hypothetical protein
MHKAAVVVLAGTDTSADAGRIVNALTVTKEFSDAGDEVRLIFEGAGTQWIPRLETERYEYHDLYLAVREHVSVCDYCVSAYEVDDAVDAAGLERLATHEGHPSVRSLVADDYDIITF